LYDLRSASKTIIYLTGIVSPPTLIDDGDAVEVPPSLKALGST
jgi:hypothetical protein